MSFDSEREPNFREDNRVASAPEGTDNKVDRLQAVPLDMAKAKVGAAMKRAMDGRALKEFGEKSFISNVHSGEKVPEYFARVYMDPVARRRFALALLEGDEGVRVNTKTTIEWDEEKVG